MPDLVPGIHAFLGAEQDVDGRDKPGHDDQIDCILLQITKRAPFHKHSRRFSPCSAGFPELRRPPSLLHFASKLEIHRRAVEL